MELYNFPINYVQQTFQYENDKIIGSDEIINEHSHLIIAGVAGSGKTTFCQYLEYTLEYELYGKNKRYPLYISARYLCTTIDATFIIEYLSKNNKQYKNLIDKNKNVNYNKLLLIIDALDEIPSNMYSNIIDGIIDFCRINPQCKIIITTRPGSNLSKFEQFIILKLMPLDQSSIFKLIKLNLTKKESDIFLSYIESINIKEILSNPLILYLSIFIFKSKRIIPQNKFFLLKETIDYILSSWENIKNIGSRSNYNLGDIINILKQIAYYLYSNTKSYINIRELKKILPDNKEEFINYFNSRGVFVEESYHSYAFEHKMVYEYFVALHFIEDKPIVNKINLFDVSIADLILESKDFFALSLYINQIKSQESEFINKLINIINKSNHSDKIIPNLNDSLNLSEKWKNLLSEKELLVKGNLFEEFISMLFSKYFKIVNKKFLSHNGEFDLIIENGSKQPFWTEYNTDYLIECKYWGKKIPIKEVLAFSQKVLNSKIKLAFFVSVNGFTKDALREFENISNNTSSPLLVPITGKDINELLDEIDNFEESLKKLVRKIKYLKKY